MVQVLRPQEKIRKPSLGEKFSNAVGAGLQNVSQIMAEKQKLSQLANENKAIKENFNIDLSNINDPDLRKAYFSQEMKNQGKMKQLNQKQEAFGKIFNRGKGHQDEEQPQRAQDKFGFAAQGARVGGMQPDQEPQQQGMPNKGGFDASQLTDQDILELTNIDPNMGRQAQHEKDVALREKTSKRDFDYRTESDKKKLEVKEKQGFHKESGKFDESLDEQAAAAEKKNRAMDAQMKNIDKIGWWDRFVGAALGNTPWADLVKSKNAQEFDSLALPQLEGQRQILGGILSDSDIRLIMQKIVTSTKDPEANKAIEKWMRQENDYTIAKRRIGDGIKAENGGYRPANYKAEINKRFEERYADQIKQNYARVMALKDDPEKLRAIGRRPVTPGTKLGDQGVDMYFEMANGDPIEATRLAREDGYDVPD
jgi:hypothetical protein